MIFILLFLLSTLIIGMIGITVKRNQYIVESRLEKIFNDTSEDHHKLKDQKGEGKKKGSILKSTFQTFSKAFQGKSQAEKWEQALESAGIPLKAEEFVAIRLLAVIFSIMAALTLDFNLFITALLPIAGWMGPVFYLNSKRKKRIQACSDQLPQALGTIGTAMKSGFSFMQAMQMVAKEVADPLGPEFEKTIREINLGISMEQAFHNLLERLPNNDLKLVVTAVLIQRSTGGNLAKLFETIEDTINDRVRMKDELKALTSQGKMSAIIISLLPVALGVLLNVISPTYFSPMLQHPLGLVLLGLGAVSGFIGWMVIQKIVRIEV
ncbi:type II secretion system F family protein [Salinibacillus xinjiangensis]|nr:type II secretion system F family protein [Salinibacillus xinjiangensis]